MYLFLVILMGASVVCLHYENSEPIMDQVRQEEMEKISIISYRKDKISNEKIQSLFQNLRVECNCNVEHLPNIGAFILTYTSKFQKIAARKIMKWMIVDGINESDDQVITIPKDELDTISPPEKPYGTIDSARSENIIPPNEYYFQYQWALHNLSNQADINIQEGWMEYLSDQEGGNTNGTQVIVAVIDTGVKYDHEDLKNIMWTNTNEVPDNGIDDDNNGIVDDVFGVDFSGENLPGDPMDHGGHGTHCAGIIAADKNGLGVAGVTSYTKGKVKS